MSYTTFEQVKAIVDTDMTDAEVTSLITESDAYINIILNEGTLSATILQMLSRLYTAYVCMRKDPDARAIGGYSENRTQARKDMKQDFDDLVLSFSGGGSFVAHVDEIA